MAVQHLRLNVFSSGTGTDTFFLFIMIQNQPLSNAALLSGLGTSAHDTGRLEAMNTNPLRFYTPRGTRRRKPSSTSVPRASLAGELLRSVPGVRGVRLKDTGVLFIGRVRLSGGKTVTRKAYNLKNLRGLLLDATR